MREEQIRYTYFKKNFVLGPLSFFGFDVLFVVIKPVFIFTPRLFCLFQFVGCADEVPNRPHRCRGYITVAVRAGRGSSSDRYVDFVEIISLKTQI